MSRRLATALPAVTGLAAGVGGDCPGRTIEGRSGPDNLRGGARGEQIFGRGGNDVVNGNGGFDCIFGGSGNDTLNAVDGSVDSLDCGAGRDTALVDSTREVRNARSCERVRRR